ncbi:Outer membrane protein beta-barrel domain-containing protein [Hymenobacter daecheongensis DSM 21074]|uniref:Outer membrane protein beta-barrel domain-containing protein n=1 Tax=Hymenobacter daecheongensis DSM 21074 TaxID=1121955 RepID=A0A1M5ZZF1_9BACT|nr:porin family protein [Hymenobacter daecheongensis]SHI29631.1 Outer membrane protein beta-barrel domain-containing protein [Hymenobacter daecheongensis DSM 21074]
MKKTSFLLAALLSAGALFSSSAQAQVRLGLKAGANYSNLSGDLTNEDRYESKFGPHGGLMVNFDVTGDGFFSVQPELLYSQKGFQYADNKFTIANNTYTYKGKVNYNYLELPVMLKINAGGLFFEAGPQVGYLMSVNDNVETTLNGQPQSKSNTYTNLDNTNRVELGYAAGLGYQSEAGPLVGLRYNGGLSKYGKSDAPANDFNNARNSAIQLYVGYMFGGK